jgi:NADH-quinone oxidoreductase subunit J
MAGIAVSAMVFTMLGWAVLNSSAIPKETSSAPVATVKNVGNALMTKFVLPLEIIGLVLTAAMIGAVIIALREDSQKSKPEDGGQQ